MIGIAAFKAGLVSEANPVPPALVPSITATQTVGFATGGDVDGDTKADPGDTLQYTTTITNSGTTDATGVVLTDDLTPATRPLTVVGGTVNISPIAANDTYNTIGNVNIAVPTGGGRR